MKIFNLFAYIFAIFAALTFGSLLLIIALHILSADDAVLKLREIYNSPVRSFQTGLVGSVFIMVGLAFSKFLVKKGSPSEALILQSEIGPLVVSVTAIEDVVKKVLKRFHLVKEWKVKTLIQGKGVQIKLRLVLWSGGRVPELLAEIQSEISSRVKKLTGPENRLEVTCDVHRIEDHGVDVQVIDHPEAASVSSS